MHETMVHFYDEKYRRGDELARTSKIYTLECIPTSERLTVLDVGCGTGLNSRMIMQQGHEVFGVDISAEAIERYTQRGFEGKVMDLEDRWDFVDSSYDVVFCSEIIEHVTAPEHLVSEMYRVVRPGGLVILSTPNSSFWLYRLGALIGIAVSEMQHPKHLQFFSRRSLRRLLEGSGFRVQSSFGRNMYLLLPDSGIGAVTAIYAALRLRAETRLRTGKRFWHLSHRASFLNAFFADTLIVELIRPAK